MKSVVAVMIVLAASPALASTIPVPEPSGLGLLAAGVVALLAAKSLRK